MGKKALGFWLTLLSAPGLARQPGGVILRGSQNLTCVKQGEYRHPPGQPCRGTIEVQIDPKKPLLLSGPGGWRAKAWLGGTVPVQGPDCNELSSSGSGKDYLEGNANVYRAGRLVKNVKLKSNRFAVIAGPAYGKKLFLKRGSVSAALDIPD